MSESPKTLSFSSRMFSLVWSSLISSCSWGMVVSWVGCENEGGSWVVFVFL